MLVSLSKLLQQKTDSVLIQIQDPHSGLKSDLNALDGPGFQWFPLERKKGLKALISITYRIQWNSVAQYLERETRLELATPTLARSCSTN